MRASVWPLPRSFMRELAPLRRREVAAGVNAAAEDEGSTYDVQHKYYQVPTLVVSVTFLRSDVPYLLSVVVLHAYMVSCRNQSEFRKIVVTVGWREGGGACLIVGDSIRGRLYVATVEKRTLDRNPSFRRRRCR